MKDRPEPLAFLGDDLDFYNHDHHHYRQEVKMSVAHLFLQIEAGGETPPAFPFWRVNMNERFTALSSAPDE